MKKTKYTTRYVSRIVLEAETPLAIGSGKKSLLTDALVSTDVNGLPFIPATSLAGVIRSACGIKKDDRTPFGYQENDKGEGSRILFSDGVMLGKDGLPVDGINVIDTEDNFYSHFKTLPIRQHVRINDHGTTDAGGKFDEQVAYKGLRFCFEMELLSTGTDEERSFYEAILKAIRGNTFRIGSGTRSGFGLMKTISIKRRDYDLSKAEDLESYVSRSALLSEEMEGEKELDTTAISDDSWLHYELILQPVDFFMFGSGMGDDDADMTPVKEAYVVWEDGKPKFQESCVLIPATSVKGALAHRVAYHWNKLNHNFADKKSEKPDENNQVSAVEILFGKSEQERKGEIKRGNVMFSDVLMPAVEEKILNHVAIDRFTGGSIDGALFTEKVTSGRGMEVTLHIDALKDAIADKKVCEAFEASLRDITEGLLPLGGGVNRGNGMFTGKITKNE